MIWAKKDRDNFHLLINHMLDVYHTANFIIETNISIFSKLKSISEETQSAWSAIIGLHDIGKATPDFQKNNSGRFRHEHLSVLILFRYLIEKLGIEEKVLWKCPGFQAIKFIILHHSKFNPIRPEDAAKAKHSPTHPIGDITWRDNQYDIIDNYLDAVNISASALLCISFKEPSDAAYFSGLMTLADWVGSDANIFYLENDKYEIHEYLPVSLQNF